MPLPRLLSFEGRARRREWWAVNVVLFVVSTTAFGTLQLVAAAMVRTQPVATALAGIFLLLTLVVTWVQLAVGVRRSHDRDQSGTGLIILVTGGLAVSMAGTLLNATGTQPPTIPGGLFLLFGVWICALLAGLYFFVTLGFLPGTPTANSWGAPP